MEISSITRVFVFNHRFLAFGFLRIFLTSVGASSLPRPIPEKLCKVIPPMLQAARPVDAVTATLSGSLACFFFSSAMIARIKTDFPVPAGPVKNTLWPLSTTRLLTWRCSLLSVIAAALVTDLMASRAGSGSFCWIFSCFF
ncbi:hypothetical protein QBC46DRAFT_265523 [Diplogelasinospora grovesii]|uniref:Uncharacterized protein n=1 Tax=Diplogelasinospora grovesii TaxID=303347 RepID=A0AAN6S2S5_9PEZI|nr:hypothetical protein QBC46DRAFT_265523 [Diplogelasinospora grovesii]